MDMQTWLSLAVVLIASWIFIRDLYFEIQKF